MAIPVVIIPDTVIEEHAAVTETMAPVSAEMASVMAETAAMSAAAAETATMSTTAAMSTSSERLGLDHGAAHGEGSNDNHRFFQHNILSLEMPMHLI